MLNSFGKHNPDMRHLVFSKVSAEEFIRKHFGPREVTAFRACGPPAMQADYLRYCAIYVLGGVYADADLQAAAPLSSLLHAPHDGTLFGWTQLPGRWQNSPLGRLAHIGRYRVVLNSLFAFRSSRHPLLKLSIVLATAGIEQRVSGNVAAVTGPGVFSRLYLLHELGSFDAYIAYAKGTDLEPSSALTCEMVGTYEFVEHAFEGVRVQPASESHTWAAQMHPAYKKTDAQWMRWSETIYR